VLCHRSSSLAPFSFVIAQLVFDDLMALQHADLYAAESSGGACGPLGRFAWKFHSGDMRSPFHRLLADAEKEGST
jgi:hypothetical protein